MSYKATMKIDSIDDPYKVLNCSYSIGRNTDMSGQPSTDIRAGIVHVSVATTSDTNLSDWMFTEHEYKGVEIVFFKQDGSEAKTLKLSHAIPIDYSESFSAEGMPMIANLSISAQKIEIGGGEHENAWVS